MAILSNKVTVPSDIMKPEKSADYKFLKKITLRTQQKTIHPGLRSKVTILSATYSSVFSEV